jgi:L-threonylcarbamoyladenylate synthase
MQTKIISVSSEENLEEAIKLTVKLIDKGEIIAFPTDTLYGLGCDAFNVQAIKKLYQIKKRDFSKPINVLIGSEEQLPFITDIISPIIEDIIKEFWPGDLTLILNKRREVPDVLTAGLNTIGVRMPDNSVTLRMIREIGKPLATTSANISGKPSITNAQQIIENFNTRIPLILDGGDSKIGQESTIISLVTSPPKIVRQGSLPLKKLRKIIHDLEL